MIDLKIVGFSYLQMYPLIRKFPEGIYVEFVLVETHLQIVVIKV